MCTQRNEMGWEISRSVKSLSSKEDVMLFVHIHSTQRCPVTQSPTYNLQTVRSYCLWSITTLLRYVIYIDMISFFHSSPPLEKAEEPLQLMSWALWWWAAKVRRRQRSRGCRKPENPKSHLTFNDLWWLSPSFLSFFPECFCSFFCLLFLQTNIWRLACPVLLLWSHVLSFAHSPEATAIPVSSAASSSFRSELYRLKRNRPSKVFFNKGVCLETSKKRRRILMFLWNRKWNMVFLATAAKKN